MNLMELLGQKVGKRMAAFAWGAYQVNQAEDLEGKIIIAMLVIGYLVCQTVSDREKDVAKA